MTDYDQGLSPEARTYFHLLGVQTQPSRSSLLSHPVYRRVDDLPSLRIFMTSHVFAVWDFMTLLKSLQRSITCIDLPWVPPADRICARLINEIVLEEESDEVEKGYYTSHFELYLEAMAEVGADQTPVVALVDALRRGESSDAALAGLNIPAATKSFTKTTLALAQRPPHEVAAAFLLGREAIIPAMFRRILGEVNERGDRWSRALGVVRRRFRTADQYHALRLYLDRHIDLDTGTHTPMGERLLMHLCGTDRTRWDEANRAAQTAIAARIKMWDGVVEHIRTNGITPGPPRTD